MARKNDPNHTVTVATVGERPNVKVGKPSKIVTSAMRAKMAFPLSGTTTFGMGSNPYSPELSTDFLELPQSIDEQRQFYRFFYDNDPFVGRAVDLHSELPLSKLRLRKPKAKNKELAEQSMRFCERWIKKSKLLQRLMAITHEFTLLGEVVIFAEDNNPEMPRDVTHEVYREVSAEGELIEQERERPDATERMVEWLKKNYQGWTAIKVLPPEQIHMEAFSFTDEKIIELVPSEKDRSIVQQADMGDLRAKRIVDSMPQELVEYIRAGMNIPLQTDPYAGSFVYYMARKKSDYEPRGKSILQRCLRTLIYRDKLRQAQTSIASRHMTPMRLIYAEDMDANQTEELREQVDLALQDPDYSIITNFQVSWEEMGADQRLLDLSGEYDLTDRQLYSGLGMNESLLSGESSYSGDRIHLEVINIQYLLLRELLMDYVDNYLLEPMCARMGFIEEDEDGHEVIVAPKLSFTRLALRDNQETFDALFNLYQKGSLDIDTILDLLNIDPETVKEKLERDVLGFNDATFNEVLRGMYSSIGNALAENSDAADRIASTLGLNYTKPKEGQSRFASLHRRVAASDDPMRDAMQGLVDMAIQQAREYLAAELKKQPEHQKQP